MAGPLLLVTLLSPVLAQAPSAPRLEAPSEPRPVMRWDRPVLCGYLQPSPASPSGHYRVQCDDAARVCLVSPPHVLDSQGAEGPEPLARVNRCLPTGGEDFRLRRAGYRFVPAIAEAPPGWLRDERGRVFQVNFDLNRRIYFGGAYAPALGASSDTRRWRADFGVELEWPVGSGRRLSRLHLLETELRLGLDSALDGTLVRYDWSAARDSPPLWITTFIGRPRRFDLHFDLGGWLEVLRLESVVRSGRPAETFLTLASANLTVDLWHSGDLVSYLRVRAGPGLELDPRRRLTLFKPEAAVEGDFTLDRDGFHHLRFSASGEKLLFGPAVEGRARSPQRLEARAGYELILLAINDYPLSLVVDAVAGWRDDLPDVPPTWEWGAEAGLRFSFWAPARRNAPPQAR